MVRCLKLMRFKVKETNKQPRRNNQQLGAKNRNDQRKGMVTGKQGGKLRDILGSEELKIPTDKRSIIIFYEGQTLMNTYYCLLSTFTMKIYCYKAGLQTAEQDCICVETEFRV